MKQTDRLILAARIFDAVYQMTLMQEKDNNPDHWKTINGAHVHVDENGNYDGGAGGLFNGKHHYGKGYKEKAEKDRQKAEKVAKKEKEKKDKDFIREVLKKHWYRATAGCKKEPDDEADLEKHVNWEYEQYFADEDDPETREDRIKHYKGWEYDDHLAEILKRVKSHKSIFEDV